MPRLSRLLDHAIPLAMLALALLWRVADPGDLLHNVRLKVFDVYQEIEPREPEAAPVRIVDIDDQSLARIGQWPWPRTVLAQLITNLADGGAVVIALDMMFPEPDRTSPNEVAKLWPDTPAAKEIREAIQELPDHDRALADAIGNAPVVTGFTLTAQPSQRPPALKGSFAVAGDDPTPFIRDFPGAVVNLEPIEAAAQGNGSLNMLPDADGVVRRVPLVLRQGAQLYPSLAAEALRVALGQRTVVIRAAGANQVASFGANSGINAVRIGPATIPTDSEGQLWLHFSRGFSSPYIPAWRVISGDGSDLDVGGAIVFVGTSYAGVSVNDLKTTPINPAMPGVEAHAEAVEQVLTGHFLVRPDWAEGAELSFILVLGLGLMLAIDRVGALPAALLGLGAIGAALAGSWYEFHVDRLLLDPVMPSFATLAVYLAASLVSFRKTEAERERVRGAFRQYLSPALVDELARDPSRLRLGGETRDMTFLFCDVRGFTSISEGFKANPQGLTHLINRLLTPLSRAIMAERGTIDKYMGDCIMAFWNAPIEVADHARHACRAALAMLGELARLNQQLAAEAEASGRAHRPLAVGVGLNSGTAVVGNMGSDQRFDYSVLGDAVNLAARLEGQSKAYGVTIVVGEETRLLAPEFAAIELDLIAVKGKAEAARIYALLGDREMAESQGFQDFARHHALMIKAYRAQVWDEAERELARALSLNPGLDGLYAMFSERIGDYRLNPPGDGWDGVYVAKTK